MNYTDLTGKIAVITGSARGIGFECAKMMAEAGAKVVISDINAEGAEKSASELRGTGLDAVAIACDVGSEESVKNMAAKAGALKGSVDILVNNAGILDPTPLEEMTVEKWDRMFAINLRGVQLCSQHILPFIIKTGNGGRIINVSSQGGQLGGSLSGIHYAAAKGGIFALSKSYARHCAPYQITVNCVAPGFMLTDMTKDRKNYPDLVPLKRLGTALDAAKAVFFLATGLSDYITGATIDVNGGYYMRA